MKQSSVNIATYSKRVESGSLRKTIDSLKGQFENINIFFNGYKEVPEGFEDVNGVATGEDFTDNAKFYFIQFESGYYFTADDDLIYPPDYKETLINAIETFNCIVTLHGRLLLGYGLNYYHGHRMYHLNCEQKNDIKIDVCGTGVTAFDLDYFKPNNLYKNQNKCMSDVIFSHEASIQNKTIGLIRHETNWLKHTINEETIYETHRNNCEVQTKIANGIWNLKYPKI